jgi:hypothetical protein
MQKAQSKGRTRRTSNFCPLINIFILFLKDLLTRIGTYRLLSLLHKINRIFKNKKQIYLWTQKLKTPHLLFHVLFSFFFQCVSKPSISVSQVFPSLKLLDLYWVPIYLTHILYFIYIILCTWSICLLSCVLYLFWQFLSGVFFFLSFYFCCFLLFRLCMSGDKESLISFPLFWILIIKCLFILSIYLPSTYRKLIIYTNRCNSICTHQIIIIFMNA